jgi:hypothetical protein
MAEPLQRHVAFEFLSELADKFGSPREYVTGFLGVEPAIISDLRALYVSGS